MSIKRIIGESWSAPLRGVALTVFVGLLCLITSLGYFLTNESFDIPFVVRTLIRGDVPVDEVTIIYMDDESYRLLKQSPNPDAIWDRALHARLIEDLVLYGPTAIVFDVWFDQPGTNDSPLFAAIARATNAGIPVIVAGKVEAAAVTSHSIGDSVLSPFSDDGKQARKMGLPWGVPETSEDRTVIRCVYPPREPYRRLAAVIAEYTQRKAFVEPATPVWLNYYGPPPHLRSVSYHNVLDETQPPRSVTFSNKVVFIGDNSTYRRDYFETPWSGSRPQLIAGVELNAFAYLNLVRGDSLHRLNPWSEVALIALCGTLLALGLARCRPSIAIPVALGASSSVALLACAGVLLKQKWFPWLIPVAIQMPVALVWSVLRPRLADQGTPRDSTVHTVPSVTNTAPVLGTATTASQPVVMNATTRDTLFISYSHKDAKFLDHLLEHLKPFEEAGVVTHRWSDKQITPGSHWFQQITDALASTKVVVMMVSPAFLASDFIRKHELGPLLKEAEQGGVRILWIPIRASAYKETPLKDYQAVIPPEKPIARMTKAARDEAWVTICEEIKKALKSE